MRCHRQRGFKQSHGTRLALFSFSDGSNYEVNVIYLKTYKPFDGGSIVRAQLDVGDGPTSILGRHRLVMLVCQLARMRREPYAFQFKGLV